MADSIFKYHQAECYAEECKGAEHPDGSEIACLKGKIAALEKERDNERRMKECQRKLAQDAHAAFHEVVAGERGVQGMHGINDDAPADFIRQVAKQRDEVLEKSQAQLELNKALGANLKETQIERDEARSQAKAALAEAARLKTTLFEVAEFGNCCVGADQKWQGRGHKTDSDHHPGCRVQRALLSSPLASVWLVERDEPDYRIVYVPNTDPEKRRHTSWLKWASAGEPPEDFGVIESLKKIKKEHKHDDCGCDDVDGVRG